MPALILSTVDLENFVKPTQDAVAAGPFCPAWEDLAKLRRWDFDDSNFTKLFITRLFDAESAASEGLARCVTCA